MHMRSIGGAVWGAGILLPVAVGVLVAAQTIGTDFEAFWGPRYRPRPHSDSARAPLALSNATAEEEGIDRPEPVDARSRLIHWNRIAIDASGVDHTPVAPGESRVFGEQIGPGRASRAMAIVHIAIADAVSAILGGWRSFSVGVVAHPGASVDAAIAQAAHDTLIKLFPSQATSFGAALADDLDRIAEVGKDAGRKVGARAAAAILKERRNDGSEKSEPLVGINFTTSNAPGKWRQDPVSQIPVALGAYWGTVRPFVIASGRQFRVPPPPALESAEYTAAFDEVKRLGGDGLTTVMERTPDQSSTGIFWAYDGMPSLCAPPRLYNQVAVTIADQMGSDVRDLTRLLALVNVAMADAGIAVWESKYHYQFWRPVTGVREADPATGPSGDGDGNSATIADPTFLPLGAPASNLSGPGFTPPFPAYPSGHAGFGGAVFEVLRRFYGTDAIAFTFVSDEYNGLTLGADGLPRPLHPRSFASLSEAEEENGQSRIYLGIHWSFDKTEGIAQGRRIAEYVMQNAFERK
jgi:hypothetical protein